MGGRTFLSLSFVLSVISATSSPSISRASERSMPAPPPFVTMPMRFPFRGGCLASTVAKSNSSGVSLALCILSCLKTDSYILSEPLNEPVWVAAAAAPAFVLPDFMATIGFLHFLAASMNFFPSFIPSMYMAMTLVCGSLFRYSISSASSTSILFPTLITFDNPILSRFAWCIIPMQRAPLWLASAICPGSGIPNTKDASRSSTGFLYPMVFGPIILIPVSLTISTSWSSRTFPLPPISPNPADMIITPATPLRAHSLTTFGTNLAGMVIRAKSTSSSIARTLG